ncbi:hemagglutinin repeat-containing protein [Fusobacterium pseudoperiodonticum]|nr:hemagglutinin repeat-containing protein [Fusobacterium pseudoperiodonticum]
MTKNTLNSITEEQGNIIKAGGSFVVNNASIVDNSGKIIAKNNVLIKSKNIYQNAAYSDTGIYANDVALIAKENIENIGGNIVADDNVFMYSENGDIKNSKKLSIHENDYHDVFTDVRGSGNIVGNNISIVANNVENLGADIKAENKIEIGAKKNLLIGNLEAVDKKVKDGKKDYVSDEKRTNVGSNLNAKDISLTSLGDIGISGSNIVATNEASIQAKGDIAVVAGKDSILHKEKHSKSKGFGRSESSTDIKYNEKLVPTQIIGKDVDIVSEKNITVVGSNLLAENKLNIGAKEDINIISGKQGSSEVHQKTKTGFMKLSGRMSLEDNLKYENISSNVQAGKEVNLVSEKNINILASNISSKENINILAKKDVNILAGDNVEENYKKETKYRTSLFADFKGLNFEIGAKIKGSQTKEGIHKTTVASSNINAGKDLYIKSGNDTTVQAANFTSENMLINAGQKLNIIDKKDTFKRNYSSKEIELKLALGVKTEGIKETLKSSLDVVKNSKELLKMPKIAQKLLSGKDLNEALAGNEGAIEEANLIANGPKSGNAETGLYLSGSFINTKGNSNITNSVGSKLISQNNLTLKSGDDMNLTMVDIISKNISIDASKNINISAGKSTEENNESTKSLSGTYNLLTDQFSIGANATKDKLEAENYSNSKIIGENINIKGKDLTVKGANIEGNDVNINVANLHLESLQDKLKSKHQGYNVSIGKTSLGMGKEYSAGLGMEYGNYDKSWVNEQSSIIGKNSSNITVEGKTNLIGSVIGGGNTTLRTGELEYSDIHDKDKGYNFGISGSASFSKKRKWDENTQTTTERIAISKNGGLNYGATDREQINRATIGTGTIIVDGKTINSNINRDENKAQIVTKDINVDKISLQYSDNTKKWSMDSVEETLGEQFKNLTVAPLYGLINKYNWDKKFKILESENNPHLIRIKKESENIIPKIEEKDIDFSKPIDRPIDVYVNGMYNDFKDAKGNLIQHIFKRNSTDIYLNNMKIGEKEYLLFHNDTRGFIGDVIECGFDKFGVKGNNHIYSKAAQQLGEMLFRNKGNFPTTTLFSQGNIQYYAALNYLEDKYGEGVLEDIIGTKKYNSYGSPLKREDFINFLQSKKIKATVNSKNDKMDGVANVVGGNAGNVIRDKHLEELFNIDKIRAQEEGRIFYINKQKLNPFTAHSFIFAEQETTTPSYRKWQKIRNGYDDILRLFNSDTYKDFFNNKKEEKRKVVKMKNRIFYFILFSIFLISCTDLKFIGKPAYVLPEYDTVIYGPIENGKVNRMGVSKNNIEKMNNNILSKYGITFQSSNRIYAMGNSTKYYYIKFYNDFKFTLKGKEYIIQKEKIKIREDKSVIKYEYPIPVDITKNDENEYILDIGEIEILDRDGKIIKNKEKIPPFLFKKTLYVSLISKNIYYNGWAEDYPGNLNELKKLKK